MTTLRAAPPPKAATTPPPRPPAVAARPPAPAPFHWTIDAYYSLNGNPTFDGLRTMLIDGVIYAMAFPGPLHDGAMIRTQRWLSRTFDDTFSIRNQMGFGVGANSDPGPDFAVVAEPVEACDRRRPETAALVVEVADSSLAIDTGRKAGLYATAGVPDYWVLDVEGRELHVFRDPQAGAYTRRDLLKEADTVAPLAAPDELVVVAALLPAV